MRLFEKRTTTVVLLAINGVMLALLYVVSTSASVSESAGVALQDSGQKINMPKLSRSMKEYQEYEVVTRRPLFWSERQGIVGDDLKISMPEQTVVPFVLIGVVTGADGKALLTKSEGKEITTARKGDVVEGWRVEQVEREYVVLTAGGLRRELHVGELTEKSK